MGSFGPQTHIGNYLAKKTFRLQPRFTIVHHPVRQKFSLSLTTYAVIDSVHENGGDKLVHGSGGISQPRAE